VLVLEVGARGLGLHAAGAGAVVGREEDDVGERDGAGEGRGGVEAVLEEEAELVGLGFPDRMDRDGAVGGEGGVRVGVDAVGEGRGCGGCEVGDVDGEFVGLAGVGYEDAVGADGLQEGELVESDCFMVWGC
jgi:hypothetical protein